MTAFAPFKRWACGLGLGLASVCACAQAAPRPAPQPDPVVQPQVERRSLRSPQLPSRDIAFGLMGGVYGTQNFGSSAVGGVRLGYHVTEDFFVDGVLAQTRVSDSAFRQVLPGGIFPAREQTLRYQAVSVGYNALTGEAFFGTRNARALQGYVLAGIGSTDFAGQRKQTLHLGLGLRVLLNDRFALQVDMRDHLFPLDLLGQRQNTHNLELCSGLTVYF